MYQQETSRFIQLIVGIPALVLGLAVSFSSLSLIGLILQHPREIPY